MAVVTIVLMMKNSNYQQSFVFSMHFGSSCPSSSKLASLYLNTGQERRLRYEKEKAKI